MAMLKERELIAGEDPEIVMVKIARTMSEWFLRYWPKGEEPEGVATYEGFLRLLRDAYELSLDEDFERTATPSQRLSSWQYSEMVRLCAEAAKPVATYVWVQMVPEIRNRIPQSEWLLEKVVPMDFSIEDGLFIFGVDSPPDAKCVWERHIPVLRWGIGQVLPSQAGVTIEIWDNDINVWTDEWKAA